MNYIIKRRQFIQTSALATAGALLATPSSLFSRSVPFQPGKNTFDRSLTPFLLMDDLQCLIQISDLHHSVRRAFKTNKEYFQVGKAWSLPPEEQLKLFTTLATEWSTEYELLKANAQFSMLCGLIAHQTFDKWLKPGTSETITDLQEKTVYQDTYVMKMLQNADPNRMKVPLNKSLSGVKPEEIAEALHLIQQRNLIRMHTQKPEFSDADRWIENFMCYYNQMKKDNLAYGKVYCQPDASKVEQYVTEPNFYDENDLIIRVARKIQMVQAGKIKYSTDQLINTKPNSIYGKALQNSLQRMMICGHYITGDGNENTLKTILDVG